jgi:hypothetical protein
MTTPLRATGVIAFQRFTTSQAGNFRVVLTNHINHRFIERNHSPLAIENHHRFIELIEILTQTLPGPLLVKMFKAFLTDSMSYILVVIGFFLTQI